VRSDETPNIDEASEQALDALLKQARFPQASAESEQRLRQRWIALSRQRRMARAVAIFAASAVIVLVIGVTIAVMTRPEPNVPKYIAVLPDPPALPTIQSRSANLWEQLVVRQVPDRKTGLPATRPAVARAPQAVDVTHILNDVANPMTRATALQSLRQMSNPPVERLAAELRHPLVQRRLAAARALGAVRDTRVTEVLGQMLAQDESRREVLAALMLSDDPSARDMLQSARRSRSIDAQCLALQSQIDPGHVNPGI
jgi:hypothetical protein